MMATIARIKQGGKIVAYKAIIKRNGKILKTKRFKRKGVARIWTERIEADVEMMEALDSPGANITCYELCQEYLRSWNAKRRKDTDVPRKVDWWSARLGNTKIVDIKTADVRGHLDDYAAGKALRGDGTDENGKPKTKAHQRNRAPATVNRMKAAASAIFKYALQQGYITLNPVSAVANRAENNKRVRWLSDEERKSLLRACQLSHWDKLYLLVILALTTGARLGELLGLHWSDINFNKNIATLHATKNGDVRILTLPTPAINALLQYREVGDGLVFPSKVNPHKPYEFRKHWNKALEKAGIDDFRFHDLRHSAASYLVMNGATLYEAAEVLGHKSTETTKRYAHLSTQHKADLTERIMGGIFSED